MAEGEGGGGLDLLAMEAYLDGLTSEAERRREAEVAAMVARGEEPASADGLSRVGLPLVWASMRRDGPGVAEVRFAFQDDAGVETYAWGEPWPRRGAIVAADALLGQLCAAWPSLAGRRLSGPVPEASPAGDRAAIGLPFEFDGADGEGLRLESGGRSRRFGAESVLVVEVLSGLADLLAAELGEGHPESLRWAGLRAQTDLPPMEIEGDGEGARDTFNEQTAWYASHLGVPVMRYSLAAVRVQALQTLHGTKGTREPGREEWDPAHLPDDLEPDAVLRLAQEAAAAQGCDVGEFMRGAVEARNMDARGRIIYGRGAGSARAA